MLKSDDLINKIKIYNKFLNPKTLSKAYDFALKAHADQKRHSGDPYVIHPVAVADILSDLKLDSATIVHNPVGRAICYTGKDNSRERYRSLLDVYW